MANERLRGSMQRSRVTAARIANVTGVDSKTVYRWVSPGRVPHPRHRWAVAKLLGEDEEYLWPDAAGPVPSGPGGTDEMIASYAFRSDVPTSVWWQGFSGASKQIDLLGYTLYFLSLQHPDLINVLQAKCTAGTMIRAVIADPDSEHVAYRDSEEGTPLTLGVRIKTTLDAWRPLLSTDGFELRYQDAPLYNSVFRFDDTMFVTPHLYGVPGSQAPLMHLRRTGRGGLFARFADHFAAIWNASRAHGENDGKS